VKFFAANWALQTIHSMVTRENWPVSRTKFAGSTFKEIEETAKRSVIEISNSIPFGLQPGIF
jgi:hypothetical protein